MAGEVGVRFSTREQVVLLVLLGAGFMLSVDFSILNVALPEAGAGVGLGPEGLPWISSAFALPAAGFTLLFGRLGDLYGRRRFFLAGMVLLAGASLLGGFAGSAEVLLTARALQGLATAMALPAALSLLTTTFAEGARRERVLGLRGALGSAGFAVGALVGGTLVSLFGWRAAFFINVPAAVAVLVLGPFVVKESSVAVRAKLDVAGAVTVTGGLMALLAEDPAIPQALAGSVASGAGAAPSVPEARAQLDRRRLEELDAMVKLLMQLLVEIGIVSRDELVRRLSALIHERP